MSEESKNDGRRTVTSVGNSWIVCKSNSHPGHIYYFNTLTGEAVWNLSKGEIEKAKRRTQTLEKQFNGKPTKCPEPKDHPPFYINKSPVMQQKFNKPHFINPFEQQSDTPFGPMNAQINNLSAFNPIGKIDAFGNTINYLGLNTPQTIYNPNVWAISQPPKIFLTPTMTPLINQAPASLNITYNDIQQHRSQTISTSNSNSYGYGSQKRNIQMGQRKFYPKYNRNVQDGKGTHYYHHHIPNNSDLRRKLCARKGYKGIYQGVTKEESIANENTVNNNDYRHTQTQEESSKLDLTPLKSLAPLGANPEFWFIVFDLDVLLKEFKFLNTLADSDEGCQLMVPKCVMSQLREYVECSQNIPARRILRFLSHQIDVGCAFMAEDPCDVDSDNDADMLLQTCIELIEKKYHVILLSNDSEIVNGKDCSNIKIFSVDEIKHILENASKHPTPSKQPIHKDRLIKIIVPNDPSQNKPKQLPRLQAETVTKEPELEEEEEEVIIVESETKENVKNDSIVEAPSTVTKRTVDTGIQTDFEYVNNSTDAQLNATTSLYAEEPRVITKPNEFAKNVIDDNKLTKPVSDVTKLLVIHSDVIKKPTLVSKSIGSTRPNVKTLNRNEPVEGAATNSYSGTDINNSPEKVTTLTKIDAPGFNVPFIKKREIKLNRCVSMQPPVCTTVSCEKKQFKWRRRRNTTPAECNKQVLDYDRNDINTEMMKSQLLRDDNYETENVDDTEQGIDENINRSVGGSESSIIFIDQCESRENITIEETTTSGIISNTPSDYSSTAFERHELINNDEFSNRNMMYIIDNASMAEYLTTKCDEWVSRFLQIMEDVLTEILYQDPPFNHNALPPPWTLHEAAQCIGLKFSNYSDVKDAANELSAILFRVSDDSGKVATNMTPHQYMEMYSYGVHLLAMIKGVAKNSQDLNAALKSLHTLLEDIRYPNQDCGTNDTFMDNSQENFTNDDDLYENNESRIHTSEHEQENDSQAKQYNLRSKRRKLYEPNQPSQEVKFIRNFDIKSSFLSTLNLMKAKEVSNNKIAEKSTCGEVNASNKEQKSADSQNEKQSVESENEKLTNTDITNNSKIDDEVNEKSLNEPKIIRNFTICKRIEDKLKQNFKQRLYDDHDDELDYEEENDDFDEYITEEYCQEDMAQENEEQNDINENNIHETPKLDANYAGEKETVDSVTGVDTSKKFKYFVQMLLKEIKLALCQVGNLCNECYQELGNPQKSSKRKYELKELADKAHSYIVNLCRSLESMLERETDNPNNDMNSLLKKADINISHVTDELLSEYRTSVTKCKNHAEVFLHSIQNILTSFNS